MAMKNPWKPGAFARLPWCAFAALVGAVGGVVGSVAVLLVSNGKPIPEWYFQPTVYLSIISTATNLMVHYALTQGVTIAWWTRALKPDTKISHLHQYWETGNSLLTSLKLRRNFNEVVTSARFIAQERALVEWSQLRLFKAKERRGYLQRIGSYKYSSSAALHHLC